MISTLKFVRKNLNGTLTCSFSKGMKEKITVVSRNLTYRHSFEENSKTFLHKKARYLAFSPQGLQIFRHFSSAGDNTDYNGVVVKHNPTKQIFCVEVDNSGVGYIDYDRKGELIVLKHTFVSKELGGRGIGKILAKEALEYVAKNDLQLEIQCSFVREYVCKYEPKYIKYIQK